MWCFPRGPNYPWDSSHCPLCTQPSPCPLKHSPPPPLPTFLFCSFGGYSPYCRDHLETLCLQKTLSGSSSQGIFLTPCTVLVSLVWGSEEATTKAIVCSVVLVSQDTWLVCIHWGLTGKLAALLDGGGRLNNLLKTASTRLTRLKSERRKSRKWSPGSS